MAHVRSAILCDFAQVREGLLFVASGGITRIAAPELEAPVTFFVAGELEVTPMDSASVHDVEFKVTAAETSITVWQAAMSIDTSAANENLFAGESLHVPFALPIGPFPVLSFGPHDLKVSIDNSETQLLTFYVLPIINPGQ